MKVDTAHVKVMRSYDYCHFEVALGLNTDDTEMIDIKLVDEMRKEAARLVDKAVIQYKISRELIDKKANLSLQLEEIKRKTEAIKENFPQSEWTAEQKAIVKEYEEIMFKLQHEYNYEDEDDLAEYFC